MARPIDVIADLSLAIDGEAIDVRGDGRRIVLDLPSLRAGRKLLYDLPMEGPTRKRRIKELDRFLRASDLTIEVRLAGDMIARLGSGAKPNATARLLNLGEVEVSASQTARSAARQNPGITFGLAALFTALVSLFWFWRSRD